MSTKTKRGQNEGSVYQRKDGRWEAILTIPADAPGGPKRQSFYGPTKRAAQDKLRAAQSSISRGVPLVPQEQTVERFLTDWLANVVTPTLKPRTTQSYEYLLRVHLIPGLGKHKLAKLTPQHVQAFLNAKSESGLSPRSVQYLRAVLRRALGQALKWDLVSRNVATLVSPPKSERHEIRPLNPEQARTLLSAVKGDRLEALYSVAVSLGLRQGEALGLQWSDVDLETGRLQVRTSLQRMKGSVELVSPKTERSRRIIHLPPSTVAALRKHKARQNEERLRAGKRWDGSWNLVFTSTIGTPLEARNVTRHFHAVLESAGLPKMRFHDLRHTCATLLLAQGLGARQIMDVLGHSTINLTMNTYAHVIPEMRHEAASMMEQILAVNS